MVLSKRHIKITTLVIIVSVSAVLILLSKNRFAKQPDSELVGADVRDGVQQSIDNKSFRTCYQILWSGASLTKQPDGFANRQIAISSDGRFAAFLASQKFSDCIIVVDQDTGKETKLPAPNGDVLRQRKIRDIAWGDDGRTLHVLEYATDSSHSASVTGKPSAPEGNATKSNRSYGLIYSWNADNGVTQVTGRVDGVLYSIAAGKKSVLVASQPRSAETLGDIEVAEFSGDQTVRLSRYHITYKGQPAVYIKTQILTESREIWFMTLIGQDNKPTTPTAGPSQVCLAKINLENKNSDAELIAKDVHDYEWSSDGQQLALVKYLDPPQNSIDGEMQLFVGGHNTLDRLRLIESKTFRDNHRGLNLAGLKKNAVYFLGQTKDEASLSDIVKDDRLIQIYELPLTTY